MKKLVLLLVALLCFTGCGSNSNSSADTDTDTVVNQEIADYLDKYEYAHNCLCDEVGCVYLLDDGTEYGIALSVIFNEKQSEEYWNLESFEPESEEFKKILEESEDYTITNLNEAVPDQAILDSYIGRTMGDLMDEGAFFTGSDLQENLTRFYVETEDYALELTANEVLPITDDIQEEEVRPLTIKEVVFQDFSSDYYYSLIGE